MIVYAASCPALVSEDKEQCDYFPKSSVDEGSWKTLRDDESRSDLTITRL